MVMFRSPACLVPRSKTIAHDLHIDARRAVVWGTVAPDLVAHCGGASPTARKYANSETSSSPTRKPCADGPPLDQETNSYGTPSRTCAGAATDSGEPMMTG